MFTEHRSQLTYDSVVTVTLLALLLQGEDNTMSQTPPHFETLAVTLLHSITKHEQQSCTSKLVN